MVKPISKNERTERRGRPRISEATKDIVVQLYNEDKALGYIAEACNISKASVSRIIKERTDE